MLKVTIQAVISLEEKIVWYRLLQNSMVKNQFGIRLSFYLSKLICEENVHLLNIIFSTRDRHY